MISYTGYRGRFGTLSKNTTATNLATGDQLINDSLRYLTGKFYFNERTYTTSTVSGQQFYPLPPQVKRLIDVTVTIGSVLWLTKPAPSREYWDSLNVIQFLQDFPSFHFVYNGNQVGVWPTPASSGNIITMNYQIRLRDLSQPDYTTGSVSVTTNTAVVTSSGSTFIADMANRWIQITAPTGDGQWYQIQSVNTGTNTLTLFNNYTGPTVSGGTFTIGEMPLLAEDYQDLALYRALWIYFTSIVPDKGRSVLYEDLYNKGYEMLNVEYGQKNTSPVLTDTDAAVYNPNLFVSSQS